MEEIKVLDDCVCVRLPDEVDHHKTDVISKKIDAYILNGQARNVIFDFEGTTFMDSSGLGLIIGRFKKVQCFGGKVFAIHIDVQIKRILYVSGIYKFIDILE